MGWRLFGSTKEALEGGQALLEDVVFLLLTRHGINVLNLILRVIRSFDHLTLLGLVNLHVNDIDSALLPVLGISPNGVTVEHPP